MLNSLSSPYPQNPYASLGRLFNAAYFCSCQNLHKVVINWSADFQHNRVVSSTL